MNPVLEEFINTVARLDDLAGQAYVGAGEEHEAGP